MAVFKRGILMKLGIVSKSLFVNKVTKTHFVNNNSSECNLLMIDLYSIVTRIIYIRFETVEKKILIRREV